MKEIPTSADHLTVVKVEVPSFAIPATEGPSVEKNSPFAGSWIRYSLSTPIDLGWNLLAPLEALWDDEMHRMSSWDCLHLGAFLQAVMNHGLAVASDRRERPRIIALPGYIGMNLHGFVWKVDTDGQTFIVLRQESADALMDLIGRDDVRDDGRALFVVSDGRREPC